MGCYKYYETKENIMNIKYVVYSCETTQGHTRKHSMCSAEKVEDAIEFHSKLKDTEFTWYEIEVEYSL